MQKTTYFQKLNDCLFKKHGMKTSIMARFLRLSIISIIIVAMAMLIFCLAYVTNMLNEKHATEAFNYSKATANTITQWLDRVKFEIEANAENADLVNEALSMEKRKALLAEAAATTEFKDFSIAYGDGKTYNDTDISDRDYFKYAMSGETYVSSPVLRKTDNSLTIMVGTKMNVDGFDGIIYGALDAAFFSEQLSMLDLGEKGYGVILDASGTIIGYPEGDNSYVLDMVNPVKASSSDKSFEGFGALAQLMTSGTNGTSDTVMPDGEEYLVGYYPTEGTEGWSVAVLLSQDEIHTDYRKMQKVGLVMAVVMLFIGFAINLLVATKIAYPVRVAANRLKDLAEGDINGERENVEITGDETGRLLKAFDDTQIMLKDYIGDIADVLDNISKGNLDIEVTKEYKGDFAAIKDNLNMIIKALNATFAKAGDSSANLLEGARQVENASQALAQASTEQASAVVQITASIEGIAKSTEENTKDVIRVNELTQAAKTEADNGDTQMAKMIGAMNEISESSQNIAKIMKVIDDIAFQTNILALNASVEAARAGVHGRGFAVVAEEVRTLAGKSAQAAGEIANMIEDSIDKIKSGTEIASDTADDLKKIVGDIDEIAGIMDRIADVSKEQAEAVGQVNKGIEQISSAVQSNSATSEECAASSVELSNQARGLAKQISYYKVRA